MSVGGERRAVALLCYVSCLLHVKRTIIPGMSGVLTLFIANSFNFDASSLSLSTRLLESIYTISVALFSLPFGYLAFTRKPFQLIAWGLTIWVIGAAACGLAYSAESYYMLLVGTVLTGAGEAAFLCNAIPFIYRHAPESKRVLWLGIWVASSFVGDALGYTYVKALDAEWGTAFYLEAGLMLPAIACAVWWIPNGLNDQPGPKLSEFSAARLVASTPSWFCGFTELHAALVGLGFAAFTFAVGGFKRFTASLMVRRYIFEDRSDAFLLLGGCGIVGGVGGGLLLDCLTKGDNVTQARRCQVAVTVLVSLVTIATVSAVVASQLATSKIGLIVAAGLAMACLGAIIPAQYVAVLERFHESRQPVAIAANTVLMAVLGDALESMALGWLRNEWVLDCFWSRSVERCSIQASGLEKVVLLCSLWLLWAVFLWGDARFRLRGACEDENRLSIESPLPSPLD